MDLLKAAVNPVGSILRCFPPVYLSSSEELWVKQVKGRDPSGRRPPQDNEFRRQKEGGEEAQSSVGDHTSALDAKTSF